MGAFPVKHGPALDLHQQRQAMRDFDGPDLAITQFRDSLQEFDNLLLEPEISQRRFWPRAVVAAHPKLLDHPWGRREDGLATAYMQAFDPTEIERLQQFDQAASSFRERRFCGLLIQVGHSIVEIKE